MKLCRIAAMLCSSMVLVGCLSGCRFSAAIGDAVTSVFQDDGDVLFNETVDNLFAAADQQDAQAIYDLFAPSVQQKNPDLMEQITAFLSSYPAFPDTNERDGAGYSSESVDSGSKQKTVSDIFVVTKEEENYYCYLRYTYMDEINADEVGVHCFSICSEKVYCDENFSFPEEDGIDIQLESNQHYDTRRMGGYPKIFTSYCRTITEEQLRTFLQHSTQLQEWKAEVGEPNADDLNLVCYYELESTSDSPRYAMLYYQKETGEILDCSCIVDDKGDVYIPLFDTDVD